MAANRKAPAKKTTAKSESTEVAEVKQGGALAAGDLAFDMSNDIGAGMEGTTQEDFAIPFLTVLQDMSPQVDEDEAKYIDGADPGMMANTVTEELFDGKEGCLFIPCAYQRRFIRWAPRGGDGGFKGEYLPEDALRMQESGEVVEHERKLWFPNADGEVHEKKCDRLVDTRNHFGLLYNPETGAASPVLLSLSSTQIKKSKQLMAILSSVRVKDAKGAMVTPPTWANMVRIKTVRESNDEGKWFGVKFSPEGFVPTADLYKDGKDFHALIAAGEAKVNYNEAEGKAEATGDESMI